MKVALYLLTQKGSEVLKALVANSFTDCISEVIVGKDKSVDNDYAKEIIKTCVQNKIRYYQEGDKPEISAPYSIAISWRRIINHQKSKLIVLHDSLLPKYRGFAPLVNALLNHEKKIGVSAIFATQDYDTGDIISQSATAIIYPIKIADAITLITQNYIELVLELFGMIQQGCVIHAVKQDHRLASYSLWRDENDYFINWGKSAAEIMRFIHAVSRPYQGASAVMNGLKKIRIIDAETVADVSIENRDPGKVIFIQDKYPIIVCGKGLLKITKATDDHTGESILPFKQFRVRLSGNLNRSFKVDRP